MGDDINISEVATSCSPSDTSKIINMMNTAISLSTRPKDFIGSHPITFLKKHISLLLKTDYLVCEKSDGIRAFLYSFDRNSKSESSNADINQKEKKYSFFVDRTNTAYHAPLYMDIENDTILDGELYYDIVDGKKYLVYAVFDCLMANGVVCMKHDFVKRMDYACKMIARIKCKFKVRVKHMYKSYGFCEVFKTIKKLNHKNDGMIFTPVNEPYKLGRCDTLLKWKPAHLNTVDFLIKKVNNCNYVYELQCFCKNGMDVFDYYFNLDDEEEDKNIDNMIGEFCFDPSKVTLEYGNFDEIMGGWKLLRIRRDKNTPNSCKIIVNVINSIKENIGYKDLEKHFLEMKTNWKRRELSVDNIVENSVESVR